MESTVSLLKICFSICLALTVVFFIISIILFFVFDIRTIFNIRTGRAKRRTVLEMQEANSRTGRLRVGGKTQTARLDKDEYKRDSKQPVIQPPTKNNAYLRNNGYAAQQNSRPTAQPYNSNSSNSNDDETVKLDNTVLLNKPHDGGKNSSGGLKKVKLNVTQKVVLIHTTEIIS